MPCDDDTGITWTGVLTKYSNVDLIVGKSINSLYGDVSPHISSNNDATEDDLGDLSGVCLALNYVRADHTEHPGDVDNYEDNENAAELE